MTKVQTKPMTSLIWRRMESAPVRRRRLISGVFRSTPCPCDSSNHNLGYGNAGHVARCFYQSNLDFYGRQLGRFRTALDLAEVLQRELGENSDINQLSDQALRRRTKGVQFNATIGYTTLGTRNATSNRSAEFGRWLTQRLWGRWVMRHKRWTVILAVVTLSGLLVLVAFAMYQLFGILY